MSRKFAVLVLILAAASAGVLYYTARIRPGGLVLTGIVTTDDVAVSSQIAGRLSRLLVKEGDTVTRDQLLAVIEPEELKADQAYFAHSEEGYSAQVQEAEGTRTRRLSAALLPRVRAESYANVQNRNLRALASQVLDFLRLWGRSQTTTFEYPLIRTSLICRAIGAIRPARTHSKPAS